MGLSLQPARRFGGKIATLIAAFALIAQPMYGLVASQVANAVSGNANLLQQAIDAAPENSTVTLTGNVTLEKQISINKSITLDGAGNSITANFDNSATDNDAVIGVNGVDKTATIKNITLDGGGVGRDLHAATVELESGKYFVRYNAQDTAKNTSTTTDYYSTVDADIPSAKVTSHTVNKDALSFKGEVEGPNLRYYYYYLTTDQVVKVDGYTFTPGQEIRLNNNTTSSRNTETVWAASGQTKFDGNLGGFNIKNVPDGNYTINLVAYDTLGNNNAATPATYEFYLDRTAPVVSDITIAPLKNDNIGGRSVTVEFKLSDASGIDMTRTYVMFSDGPNKPNQLKESEKITPTCDADYNCTATFDTTKFVKANYTGSYNLQFTMVDVHGNNTSTKPKEFRPILVDNSGPESTLNAPVSGSHVKGTSQQFKFKVTDHTGVKSGYMKIQGDSNTYTLTQDGTSDIWYATIDTTKFADGNYKVEARFVDLFGTPRYNSNTGNVFIDNNGPTDVKILNPANNSVFHTVNGQEVKLTAKDSVGLKRFDVTIWSDTNPQKPGETPDFSCSSIANGNKEHTANCNLSNSGLTDGVYTIYFTATDLADNYTEAKSVTFTINTQAPKAEITVESLIDGFTKDKDINIKGTGTPTAPYGTPIKTHFFELKTPGGETHAIYSFKNSANKTCTLDGTNVCSFNLKNYYDEDGEYKIRYVVTDEQGIRNDGFQQQWAEGTATATFTFSVDTKRPVVTGPVNIGDATVYNPITVITITATDENGSGVKNVVGHIYKKDSNGDYKLYKNNSVNGETLTIASSVFTALGEGEYYIKYNAHDNVGNVSTTKFYYFTIDTIPPVVTIGESSATSISGTVGLDATKVFVQVGDGKAKEATINGTNWSFNFSSALTVGTHDVTVWAVDAAGNKNDANSKPTWATKSIEVLASTSGSDQTETEPPTNIPSQANIPGINITAPAIITLPATNESAGTVESAVDTRSIDAYGAENSATVDGDVLAAESSHQSWSLVNLLLAIGVVLASIITLFGIGRKENRKAVLRILSVLPAIGAVVLLLSVENFSATMAIANTWSWLMAGIALAQIVIVTMTRKSPSNIE